jgi:PAS domain-containing protein
MTKKNDYTDEILNSRICGFHMYSMGEPIRLLFASENLCRLLECEHREIASGDDDGYAAFVHPGDRKIYEDFLSKLRTEGGTLSESYRLVKKTGGVIYVNDTITTGTEKDGTLVGCSVLSDITELREATENLQFLSDTMPCGFLKYTCDKIPKITYMNDQMLKFLRFPERKDAGFDAQEMYRQNIYMMIPIEDRRRFALYLKRVYRRGGPIAGDMTVLRCDGSRAHLFGWVTKCVNEQGEEEFQSACMDMTERQIIKQERETNRYLKAMKDVYDYILEFDLPRRTVKCIHGRGTQGMRWIENVPLQMEETTENWVSSFVIEEDREKLRRIFSDLFQRKEQPEGSPPAFRYRAVSSDGTVRSYTGLFVKISANVCLFCCRRVQTGEDTELLRMENDSLKGMNENMRRLVMHFMDGLAAFEIIGDMVTPLYASDNAYEFFGVTKEEWLILSEKRTPIQTFVARSKATYREIQGLLKTGEAEFVYYDLSAKRERRIRAICSPITADEATPRYVMLYNVGEAESIQPEQPRVLIRTFGYFDVFVDDKPIAFRSEKSKELLALLVDRRGGFVSSEEAIGFLWENEPASAVTLARYRKVALRLKNILEEYGISDIIETVSGKRRLVTNRVSCDLYDYLSGGEEYAQLFKGSYLSNYSWGENTLAELTGEHLYPDKFELL